MAQQVLSDFSPPVRQSLQDEGPEIRKLASSEALIRFYEASVDMFPWFCIRVDAFMMYQQWQCIPADFIVANRLVGG